MNDQQKRIAIAEFCGFEHWKASERPVVYLRRPTESTKQYWLSCGDTIRPDLPITQDITAEVPDYLHDLNAIHEAILKLDSPQSFAFVEELKKVGGYEGHQASLNEFYWFNATAEQRSEALLKVIGKYK